MQLCNCHRPAKSARQHIILVPRRKKIPFLIFFFLFSTLSKLSEDAMVATLLIVCVLSNLYDLRDARFAEEASLAIEEMSGYAAIARFVAARH